MCECLCSRRSAQNDKQEVLWIRPCPAMITRPDRASFFLFFFLVSTLLFFPPIWSQRAVRKEDVVLFPSVSSGKKHCCVPAGGSEAHGGAQVSGKYWSWKKRCGWGGRGYFLITSSLSLSARCFLFWSFFRSSADASWCKASRALRRVRKQTERKEMPKVK